MAAIGKRTLEVLLSLCRQQRLGMLFSTEELNVFIASHSTRRDGWFALSHRLGGLGGSMKTLLYLEACVKLVAPSK